MKRVYRFTVLATFSLAMVFASEANAARKNGNENSKGKRNKIEQVTKGNRTNSNRDAHVNVKNHAPKDRYTKTRSVKYVNKRPVRTGKVNITFGYGNGFHNLGNVLSYNGRIFRRQHGQFFQYTHGGWTQVRAPYGLKVDNIPYGSRRVRSRRGILHEFKGTFYLPTRNGAVVVAPPR